MSEDLYDIRNAYLLGNYMQVISEGSGIKANSYRKKAENDQMLVERDALVGKAQISMGQADAVISDLESSSDPQLQAVKHYAKFMSAQKTNNTAGKEAAVKDANDLWVSVEETLTADAKAHVALSVAAVSIQNGDLETGLKIVRKAEQSSPSQTLVLDLKALAVDIYLRISREKEAQEELKKMTQVDDDATVTQLCSAWISLYLGGDRAQEAVQVAEEMKEKFGPSVMLLNLLALAHMAQCRFDVAEKTLLDAMGKSSNNAETLINLIVCSQHMKKPQDLINRYLGQLKQAHPNHPYVQELGIMEDKFGRECQRV